MTYLVNDPKDFPAEALVGMVAANPDYLIQVHGGVVRATEAPKGEVSIVVGGGSGHYPAFAGWVGPGMAHGAVCGNIFASPSASQAESVVRAAENGGGTILLFGNYAGDCLHFGEAAETLRKEGIDTRIVTITDDIASNTPDQHLDRRGIAGDFFVVKVACAAAAAGKNIDEVERLTRKANDATRTLGVAFTGCTLPGAPEPLFTVPEGTYGLGLGIHGEPGIASHEMGKAEDIAALLVDRVMAEEPERGKNGYNGRVAVLLNGLGATKYEELFVLYSTVDRLLRERGVTIVKPVVDEQVTSLDMAGVSLSLMFMDDELEELFLAPGACPAYTQGNVTLGQRREVTETETSVAISEGSPASREQAATALNAFKLIESLLREKEAELGKLDTIAGDGDHGQGMVLGATAATKEAERVIAEGAGLATTFDLAGQAWAEGAGGTSGMLWGKAISSLAQAASDTDAITKNDLARGLAHAAGVFESVGGAHVGDKTMVDATNPFALTLTRALDGGSPLAMAWEQAVVAGEEGAESTKNFAAKKGRARTHGEKSVGHADPGAVSFTMVTRALITFFSEL